ncbi:16S rRNA processing protein RimM [Enhygromyxa salina]|uniref:Ribosome maturation factor RimM n=1 Tax=Enhygromyxa salina TaxID=215803 RepID=A0A0C2CUJ5_9BACT|nr:ribosome maturation factor RimM [Enhygromyxa salina]KIG13255.1 16S rRNA processing protein RimM [Enhygromyxa salina]
MGIDESQPNDLASSHLQLGYVAGVHGVAGALRVKLFNQQSTLLEAGLRIILRERGATKQLSHQVARVAPKPGSDTVRLWLEGIEARAPAEALRGHELWVARTQLPELDDDEYYLADLIGLEVVREDQDGQLSLGKITGVTSNTAQDLLCVRLRGREWLLPAMPPFIVAIHTSETKRCVVVDVHDDMLPEPRDP